MGTLTIDQRRRRIEVRHKRAAFDSTQSLLQYLGHVVIDSKPTQRRWSDVWEPWQGEIVGPLIPAFEQMAGLRSDYTGPRKFWFTMPRGHDKTTLLARLANWALAFSRQRVRGTAAAADKDQATILLESMLTEARLNPWLSRRLSNHNYVVRGASGTLKVVSSDATFSSGLKSDFYVCDELTVWKNRSLWDMLLSGAAKRPDSVFVVITNAGFLGSWQYEVLLKCKADPLWHVHESPVNAKLASWMREDEIASDRDKMTRSHARRVYDNIWTPASDNSLLDWDTITACHDKTLWKAGTVPQGHRPGPIYVGVDVGRTRDNTVITAGELIGDVLWTRVLRVMHKASFDQQKAEMRQLIKTLSPSALRIDKGAIGYQLAEEMEREFPRIVKGVAMNQSWQGQAALKLAVRFQRRSIRIPNDSDLNQDLQQIEEVGVGAGGVPILKTERGEHGHGDRFWSIAAAVDAIPAEQPKSFKPVSRQARF